MPLSLSVSSAMAAPKLAETRPEVEVVFVMHLNPALAEEAARLDLGSGRTLRAQLLIGATFRWFEQLCHFLSRRNWGPNPFATTRDYVARLHAAGDERTARQVEERLQDQRRRMTRYGRAMMVVGGVIVVLSVLLT